MKRILKYIMPAVAMAALLAGSCGHEFNGVDVEHVPVLNKATLTPDAMSEESSNKAYRGDLVKVKGFNLEEVDRVEFSIAAQTLAATIVKQSIDELHFRVPTELELAQSDYPHKTTLNVYSKADECVFTVPYYITVPVADANVTDFSPAEGTVGTKITLTGDHLALVRRVQLGPELIEADGEETPFTVSEDGFTLSFVVPAPKSEAGYPAGDSELSIEVFWDINSAEITSEGTMFTLHTPDIDAVPTDAPYLKPEDELTLTGRNLHLIESITWGDLTLYTAGAAAAAEEPEGDDEPDAGDEPEQLTFEFPALSEIPEELIEDFIATLPLTAHWVGEGTVDLTITLAEAYKINTSPDPIPMFDALAQPEGEAAVLPLTLELTGENLDLVERMTYGDFPLTISEQSAASLQVTFPDEADVFALLKADPYLFTAAVTGYYTDRKGVERNAVAGDYTVDVTPEPEFDFEQAAGEQADPGATIELTGRYLSSVNSVMWGTFELKIDEDSRTATSIQVTLPAKGAIRETVADDATIVAHDLTATWSKGGKDDNAVTVAEDYRIDATPDAVPVPEFDALTVITGEPGGTLELTGYNLDLVEQVLWGDYPLTISAQSESAITVTFPEREAFTGAHESQTLALTAVYDTDKTVAIADAYTVDYTDPATAPTIASVTPQDGGSDNDKFYLNKLVTVTGELLDAVTAVKIGGVEASISESTAAELKFAVPETGLTFDKSGDYETATLFDLEFVYGNAQSVTYEKQIKVYPFYFYPNVTIGAQDASNRDKAFFVPEWGRVISTDEFAGKTGNAAVDPYIGTSQTNNVVAVDKNQYYEVPAYIFMTNGSSMAIQGPANSASQIRNHRTSDNVQLTDGRGTPIIQYRNITSASPNSAETKASEKAYAGTLESVADLIPRAANSGAPKFDNLGTATNTFKDGQIIMVQHVAFDGTFNSGSTADVYSTGLMILKGITDTDGGNAANTTTITFDCYWSKPLRDK